MSERLPIGTTYPLRLACGRLFFRQREVAFIIDHCDGEILLHGGIEPGLMGDAIAIADATVRTGKIPDFAFETAKPACWEYTPHAIEAFEKSPPPYVPEAPNVTDEPTERPAPIPAVHKPRKVVIWNDRLCCPHCRRDYRYTTGIEKHLGQVHGYTPEEVALAVVYPFLPGPG